MLQVLFWKGSKNKVSVCSSLTGSSFLHQWAFHDPIATWTSAMEDNCSSFTSRLSNLQEISFYMSKASLDKPSINFGWWDRNSNKEKCSERRFSENSLFKFSGQFISTILHGIPKASHIRKALHNDLFRFLASYYCFSKKSNRLTVKLKALWLNQSG